MDIDLEFYKQFYYVAKNGSITRAANEMCISQPAISKTIKLLEFYLNTTLFVRTKEGVLLTDAGKKLYEKIKSAMEIIDAAENEINLEAKESSGVINIGTNKTIIQHYLLPFLKQFKKEHPNIKFKIYPDTTNTLLDKARKGIIDIIINYSSVDSIDNFNIIKLTEVKDILAATNEFKQYKDKKITNKDLEEMPLIILAKSASNRAIFDDYCVANDIHIKPELEIGGLVLIKDFTLSGFGVGMLQEYTIKEELKSGKLFKLNYDFDLPKKYISVYQKKNEEKNIIFQFIEELKKYKSE